MPQLEQRGQCCFRKEKVGGGAGGEEEQEGREQAVGGEEGCGLDWVEGEKRIGDRG